MTVQKSEVIVLGVGGMGSAALSQLARRGIDAIGIEQFDPAHDRGSSHGETRFIRKAYFEHPDYVPLLNTSYVMWRELAARTTYPIFDDGVGLVMMGPGDSPAIAGTMEAARLHHLPIDRVTREEAASRWPDLHVPAGFDVVWDVDGGILRVEACVRAHVDDALAHGARLFANRRVVSWTATDDGVEVQVVRAAGRGSGVVAQDSGTETVSATGPEDEAERFEARRLIIAGGAWSPELLADLALPMEVRRKVLLWFHTRDATDGRFALGRFPNFAYELGDRFIYGFPDLGSGVKIASHRGGQVLSTPSPARELLPGDADDVVALVREYFPALDPAPVQHAVCMYTMTPDENFVIDRHPRHPNVVFAAGFSGHGFKFAPVVGAALADLALDGRTSHPIGFLAASRDSLR